MVAGDVPKSVRDRAQLVVQVARQIKITDDHNGVVLGCAGRSKDVIKAAVRIAAVEDGLAHDGHFRAPLRRPRRERRR